MRCQLITAALADLASCEDTPDGCRVQTHCLYPSFETVFVYVIKLGDGFRVSDNAEGFSNAWAHGRSDYSILHAFAEECRRFHIRLENKAVVVTVDDPDWLPNAILTVANASANAAQAVVAKAAAATEAQLTQRIGDTLEQTFGAEHIGREHEERGSSGGVRRFDYIVRGLHDRVLLINGVTPHGNSVSSRYVSFADTAEPRDRKLAVFDRQLPADVKALLSQVATTVPFAALSQGAERALRYA